MPVGPRCSAVPSRHPNTSLHSCGVPERCCSAAVVRAIALPRRRALARARHGFLGLLLRPEGPRCWCPAASAAGERFGADGRSRLHRPADPSNPVTHVAVSPPSARVAKPGASRAAWAAMGVRAPLALVRGVQWSLQASCRVPPAAATCRAGGIACARASPRGLAPAAGPSSPPAQGASRQTCLLQPALGPDASAVWTSAVWTAAAWASAGLCGEGISGWAAA